MIYVLGYNGYIGSSLLKFFKNFNILALKLNPADINSTILSEEDVIINCIGYVGVDYNKSLFSNFLIVSSIIKSLNNNKMKPFLMHLSTYALNNPLWKKNSNHYFMHKYSAELFINDNYQNSVILRLGSIFSEDSSKGFFYNINKSISNNQKFNIYNNGDKTRDFVVLDQLLLMLSKIANCKPFFRGTYDIVSGNVVTPISIINQFVHSGLLKGDLINYLVSDEIDFDMFGSNSILVDKFKIMYINPFDYLYPKYLNLYKNDY